jgi:5-methylcytosine-specific restriction protein A
MSGLTVCSWRSAEHTEFFPLDQINPDTGNDPALTEAHASPGPAASERDPGRIPRRPCSVPGCPELTGNARCEAHQHAHQSEVDAHRGSSSARGYDATWRRLRRAKLATDPVCQIRTNCPGMVATEVDHKTPVRQWPEGRLDWDNLQSTCIPCHRAKTGRERLHRSSKPGGPGGRRVCGQTPSRP